MSRLSPFWGTNEMWEVNMNWNDSGNGMMNSWGYATGAMILMVLFFVGLFLIINNVAQHGSRHDHHHEGPSSMRHSSEAVDHLNMRLAKGDISPEEYSVLKGHLSK